MRPIRHSHGRLAAGPQLNRTMGTRSTVPSGKGNFKDKDGLKMRGRIQPAARVGAPIGEKIVSDNREGG